MFKTLGLFNHTRCPDESCHRPYCFFSHSISRNGSASGASTPTPASSAVRRDADGQAVKKRKVEAHESSSTRPGSVGPGDKPRAVADTRNAGGARPAATSSSSTGADRPVFTKTTPAPGPTSTSSRSAPASASTAARPVAAAAAAPSTATTTGAPIIPRDAETLKASRQPYVERQKALTTLYTQFCKLYRPLGPNHPQLAAEHALAQEAEIAKEFPALDSYKRTIHHAAVSVLRRPAPDSVHHPSIGTLRESRAKVEKAAKEALSKLSKESCSRYVLPLSEYADWGYPDYADDSLITPPEVVPDATGTEQKCDRCQSPYIVSPVPASDEDKREKMGECKFHFGKLQPHMLEGRKKWLYSCCMRERGEPGCEDGLHVFRHKDDDPALARRVPYKRVKAVCDEIQRVQGPDKASASWLEVVAIDCEMIYTTGGLSVARATVVDEKGEVVLDEIVRQTTSIVDVNARFSGLTAEEVNKAVLDLDAVRKAVCMFIGPDTIIVGHGLENDLRALRLLHDKVIDTAILLPHAKGKPYRRALREIVREKLGYVIQNMISEKGHSSAEDAQATLDVLKWKVRDDATPVDQGMLRLDK